MSQRRRTKTAKDRTRNARRTEPDSRYEPLFDVFGREMGQAIIDFGKEQWQMAVNFTYENIDCVTRLLEGEHEER